MLGISHEICVRFGSLIHVILLLQSRHFKGSVLYIPEFILLKEAYLLLPGSKPH